MARLQVCFFQVLAPEGGNGRCSHVCLDGDGGENPHALDMPDLLEQDGLVPVIKPLASVLRVSYRMPRNPRSPIFLKRSWSGTVFSSHSSMMGINLLVDESLDRISRNALMRLVEIHGALLFQERIIDSGSSIIRALRYSPRVFAWASMRRDAAAPSPRIPLR